MVLDKKIKIKITKKNIEYYRCFYDGISLKDVVEVDVETQLQTGSNLKINVCCDICNIQRKIKYQAYIKNINSNSDYPIYTCDRCSHIKLKNTNIKKYGVEYYSKHPERNSKVRLTSLEKYGVDHFSKSELFREKVGKTNLEKFGFENPFMDKDRIQFIFKEKYGVNHPSKCPEIKDKIENTMLEKYGYKNALSSPELRSVREKTMLEKYGCEVPMKCELIRRENSKLASDEQYLEYKGDSVSIFNCEKGHIFFIDSVTYHNRKRSHLDLCTVCNPVGESVSIKEKELYQFIKSIYSGEVIQSYRNNLEIDIYIPDLKIGFEFNGLYWHSEEWKDKNYHLDKTQFFKKLGIRVIHIWEDDWTFKKDIIKSQIINRLGLNTNKIYARKCEVKGIKDSKFLESNHIQGIDNSVLKLGLYYNGELISFMSFNKFEGRKKLGEREWNLSRFCNILNTSVIGGASKLFNYFIEKYKPIKVISYADYDWSDGNLYTILGFSKVKDVKPDYKYIINGVRRHKQNFKKSNLDLDDLITEVAYMKSNGIVRIWDCGKIKFEKNIL